MSKKQATVEASGVTQRSPCDWTADTRGDGGNDSDALIGLIHVSTFSQERLVNGPITASESTPPIQKLQKLINEWSNHSV
jgi:hypothetical protein